MTTTETATLLGVQVIDVTRWDVDGLLARLKNTGKLTERYRAIPSGFAWWFALTDSDDPPHLVVGIRGSVGALTWWEDDDTAMVPAGGLNEDFVDGYTTTDGHPFTQLPGAEVPVQQVYSAAHEFVRTHRRPSGIRWTAAAV